MKIKINNITVLLITSTFILFGKSMYGQARLSTLDDQGDSVTASAMLEVHSDNSGLLIPTIELSWDEGEEVAQGLAGAPADGLIIFHDGRNGIDKGMWYYDAVLEQWIIYTDFSSEQSEQDISDFGELYESNELGSGTAYDLEDTYYNPWASATVGLCGPAFIFLDSVDVVTEIGTAKADQFQITGPDAVYSVVISATLAASAPSTTVTGALFINDAKVDHLFFRHTFQLKDTPTSLNTSGNLEVHKNDKIDFRFTSSVKNKGIEIENLNIRLNKLSDL